MFFGYHGRRSIWSATPGAELPLGVVVSMTRRGGERVNVVGCAGKRPGLWGCWGCVLEGDVGWVTSPFARSGCVSRFAFFRDSQWVYFSGLLLNQLTAADQPAWCGRKLSIALVKQRPVRMP